MNLQRNLVSLISLTAIGGIVGKAFRYGLDIILAQGLGADALGLFATGLVFLQLGTTISNSGVSDLARKYIPVYRENGSRAQLDGVIVLAFGLAFAIGSSLFVALFVLAEPIADYTVFDSVQLLLPFLLAIPFLSVTNTAIAVTQGFKHTKYTVFFRDIVFSGGGFLLVGAAILLYQSELAALNAYVAVIVLSAVLSTGAVYRLTDFRVRGTFEFELRSLGQFAFSAAAATVFLQLMSWTDIMMLSLLESASSIGFYRAAFQTSILLIFAYQAVQSIYPSVVSEYIERDRRQELGKIYTSVSKWVFYFSIFGYAFFVLFGNVWLTSVFGTEFHAAGPALLVLGAAQVVTALAGPSGYLLMMADYERVELANALVVSSLNLVLNYYLIGQFGVLGAAIATGLSLVALNAARIIESWYLLGFHPFSSSYWKGILACVAGSMVMALHSVFTFPPQIEMIALGGAGGLVFLAVLWSLQLDDHDLILFESVRQ